MLLLSILFFKWIVHCSYQYQACNFGKDGFLNVHVVPHSHNDVGWLKTVEQYYYGLNDSIQHAGVQYIYETVIDALYRNPERRFIFVEIAFFWRWWEEQAAGMKVAVKHLIDQGRLRFVGGGWVINDEAASHYGSVIDQLTLGLNFISETFGPAAVPKIAWQIDSFGHSKQVAYIFSKMKYDAFIANRIDYQDAAFRFKKQTREFMWNTASSNDSSTLLFTSILPNHYSPPNGFCFDEFCADEPIITTGPPEYNNAKRKAQQFLEIVIDLAQGYKTGHLLMLMGSDFHFQNAHHSFGNLDKLIQIVNDEQRNHSRVNIFYSTPDCYIFAASQNKDYLSIKDDDFFPYAHRPHTFWSGFYTSRPGLKLLSRKAYLILQILRQFSVLTRNYLKDLYFDLEDSLAILQHHDAVSGTCKQHVASDYANRVYKSILNVMRSLHVSPFGSMDNLSICLDLNISQCPQTEHADKFSVIFYNPLSRNTTQYVRIPVNQNYIVKDHMNKHVDVQIDSLPLGTLNIPERNSTADREIVFPVFVQALSYANFHFIIDENDANGRDDDAQRHDVLQCVLENEHLQMRFSLEESAILDKDSLQQTQFDIVIGYYEGYVGNNSEGQFQSSGAYVMRPTNFVSLNNSQILSCDNEGNFVRTMTMSFCGMDMKINLTARLYAGHQHLEFVWVTDSINIRDNVSKDVVVRYETDVYSGNTFYTDSNCKQMLKRIVDKRATYPFNQSEPIAGNYYPVCNRILIQDDSVQFAVLTDRTQGGRSFIGNQSGGNVIELMLNRRTVADDALGMNEFLDEKFEDGTGVHVKTSHLIIFGKICNSWEVHRRLAVEDNFHLFPFFSEGNFKLATKPSSFTSLPENVHLLTFELLSITRTQMTCLVRIEHIYDGTEESVLSKPVYLDFQSVFPGIKSFVETSLDGIRCIGCYHEYHPGVANEIRLDPMEIKTFRMEFNLVD